MPVAPDDPWSSYARTVVEVDGPGHRPVVVRAAPDGETGVWPWPSAATVHVLTAWNPGAVRPGVEENRRRQRSLEQELAGLLGAAGRAGPAGSGPTPSAWPARGTDPVTGARDEGVAVAGLAEESVVELARRYGQDAVFAWDPLRWTIVACRGHRRLSSGWRTGPVDTPLDVLRRT